MLCTRYPFLQLLRPPLTIDFLLLRHDYLNKERQNPASKDTRVNKSIRSSKRRKHDDQSHRDSEIRQTQGTPGRDNAQGNPAITQPCGVGSSYNSAEDDVEVSSTTAFYAGKTRTFPQSKCNTDCTTHTADAIASLLIPGIPGVPDDLDPLETSSDNTPGPQSYLGSYLYPLDTWSPLSISEPDAEQFKWCCEAWPYTTHLQTRARSGRQGEDVRMAEAPRDTTTPPKTFQDFVWDFNQESYSY